MMREVSHVCKLIRNEFSTNRLLCLICSWFSRNRERAGHIKDIHVHELDHKHVL